MRYFVFVILVMLFFITTGCTKKEEKKSPLPVENKISTSELSSTLPNEKSEDSPKVVETNFGDISGSVQNSQNISGVSQFPPVRISGASPSAHVSGG